MSTIFTGMSTYTDYCEALSLAVAYTREQKGDPSFSLGIDPYADVSTFKQKNMTPKSASTTKSLSRSQTKKSGASSTGRKTSSSTSKKGRNSRIVTGPTGSPALAEAPQDNENVRSSKRKRNRDATQSEGKDPSELEVKRQRRSCGSGNTGKVEKDGGKEVVPKKLNFNDDNDEFVRTKEGVSLETPSSPVAKADHKPSSPILNGHTDRLPSLHSVKKSLVSGSVKPGADKEEEREAAGLYSCGSKNGRDDTSPVLSDDDDDMETKEGDTSSDSDDNSFPSCNFSVDEALTGRI